MSDIVKLMTQRKNELLSLIKTLRQCIKHAPEGSVHLSSSHGCVQYMLLNHQKRSYLHSKDRELAYELMQKDYDRRLLSVSEKELKRIQTFLREYPDFRGDTVYQSLSPERRLHVDPRVSLPDVFLKEWSDRAEELYRIHHNPHPLPEGFITSRGERVRSKSELIIADMLARCGVSYFYELPLKLASGPLIFPDFTILDPQRQKVYYWEHFGMGGNGEYFSRMIEKMRLYEQNGFFIGTDLLVTFESLDAPLDVSDIRRKIQFFFGK